LMQLLLVSSGD